MAELSVKADAICVPAHGPQGSRVRNRHEPAAARLLQAAGSPRLRLAAAHTADPRAPLEPSRPLCRPLSRRRPVPGPPSAGCSPNRAGAAGSSSALPRTAQEPPPQRAARAGPLQAALRSAEASRSPGGCITQQFSAAQLLDCCSQESREPQVRVSFYQHTRPQLTTLF